MGQIVRREIGVIGGTCSREYSGLGAAQRRRRYSGVLERLPCDLQKQPLLRVHLGGFAGRELEELRVELVEIGQERTPPRRLSECRRGVRRTATERRPAIGGYFGHRGAAGRKEPPQLLRARDVPGEPASESDDRDRLVEGTRLRRARRCGCGQPGRSGQEIQQGIDVGVLPELDGINRPAQQFRKFAGEHHRLGRAHPQILERPLGIHVGGFAADGPHQVVGEPLQKFLAG